MNLFRTATLFLLIYLLLVPKGWAQNKETIPVSDKTFNNADQTFRFAIVSDRTGGMRGGVFKAAIGKLNILQPEFVLSVGDLIDGYTEDPNVWNAQWDEFDTMIKALQMPFYYVPGNHDISNELLTNVWRERHGRDYYHFKYKNVLFLALNTDEIKNGGIGQDQIQYFQKVLAENNDVSWTLIFMHRPLWSYGETLGYNEIEKALGSRNYTVYSGHHHFYQFKMHNGMEHYTLATTGGGSYMRNHDVGEFDHITWVTMKDAGPITAHLELSGIHDKYIVPEDDYDDIQTLRDGKWLEVLPVISSSEIVSEIPLKMKLKNTSKRDLFVRGSLLNQQNIQFHPTKINETIPSGEEKEISLKATSAEGDISIPKLNKHLLEIGLEAGFSRESRSDVALTTSKRILLDWRHILKRTSKEITIDGEFSDWDLTNWINVELPQFFYEDWDWKGKEDGRFDFNLVYNDAYVYLGVEFKDDNLIISPTDVESLQDKFYVHLSTDLSGSDFLSLEIAKAGLISNKEGYDIDYAINVRKDGLSLEMAIPIKQLLNGSNTLNKLRVNVGVMDHDRPENTKPSVLWWRPVWQGELDYTNSGVFYVE